MITLIFGILLIGFLGKMIAWAFKATWNIVKVLLVIVFFPLILIVMACTGLIYIALIFLIIGGIISLIARAFA
jgi:putative multidrug resistance protein